MAIIEPCTWEGLEAVRFATDKMEAIIVTAFGPRLASFRRPDGQNFLFWSDDPELSYEVDNKETWFLRGGHRVWTTASGADENESTYVPDNQPCTISFDQDTLTVAGAHDLQTRTTRGMTLRAMDDDTLHVDNWLRNDGVQLYACGIWALSVTKPCANSYYLVPLGDGSSWDTVAIHLFRTWGEGHGPGVFVDEQFTVEDDVFRLTPQGRENKRMIDTPSGCIAMVSPERQASLIIHTEPEINGHYPPKANIAAYVAPDNLFVEMETMGALHTVKPGATTHHYQSWKLVDHCQLETGAAVLEALGTIN